MLDDDDDIAPLVFATADEFATEAEANEAGGELVGSGIGAIVEPIPAAEVPEDGPRASYRVMVLDYEVHRARVVLGLEEPDDRPLGDTDEPMKVVKRKADWKYFAAIWIAAMIVIPLAAFALTYWITSSK